MIVVRNSVTGTSVKSPHMGLGDMVERLVKPVAVALKLDCLDEQTKQLKPDSPCAKRRDRMNKLGKSIGL